MSSRSGRKFVYVALLLIVAGVAIVVALSV